MALLGRKVRGDAAAAAQDDMPGRAAYRNGIRRTGSFDAREGDSGREHDAVADDARGARRTARTADATGPARAARAAWAAGAGRTAGSRRTTGTPRTAQPARAAETT